MIVVLSDIKCLNVKVIKYLSPRLESGITCFHLVLGKYHILLSTMKKQCKLFPGNQPILSQQSYFY